MRQPWPTLPDGGIDWPQVATRDCPPGYDFATDRYWQSGMLALGELYEDKPSRSALAETVLDIRRRMLDFDDLGFQGASKGVQPRCRRCGDARWLRLDGYNAMQEPMAGEGSRYRRCPSCNPG